jgi:hypothetical protein
VSGRLNSSAPDGSTKPQRYRSIPLRAFRPTRTPWYPTMRLYRHRRLGEWDEVLERIARDLTVRKSG